MFICNAKVLRFELFIFSLPGFLPRQVYDDTVQLRLLLRLLRFRSIRQFLRQYEILSFRRHRFSLSVKQLVVSRVFGKHLFKNFPPFRPNNGITQRRIAQLNMDIRNLFNQKSLIIQIDRIAHLIMRRIPPSVQLFDDLIAALFGRLGKENALSVFRQRFCRNTPTSERNARNRHHSHAGNIPFKQFRVQQRRSRFRILSIKEQVIVHPHANHVLRTLGFKIPVGFHIRH